ncbi:DUF883 family protein [Orrella sp. JC864]|uniref:DUF883 family protein n=1 Tax=Orrella sp. JC864 TaxID=3120298 RepID=UPI0012BD3762
MSDPQEAERLALLERMAADRSRLRAYRYEPPPLPPDGALALYGLGAALAALAAWRYRFVRSVLGMALPVILRDRVRPWLATRYASLAQSSKESETMGIFARTERDLDRGIQDAKETGRRASRELRATGRQVQDDLKSNYQNLLSDLEETLRSGADTDIEALRTRLNAQIEKARQSLDEAAGIASGFVHEAVDTAEDHIRSRPLQSVGTVAGIAFLLGLLVGRR